MIRSRERGAIPKRDHLSFQQLFSHVRQCPDQCRAPNNICDIDSTYHQVVWISYRKKSGLAWRKSGNDHCRRAKGYCSSRYPISPLRSAELYIESGLNVAVQTQPGWKPYQNVALGPCFARLYHVRTLPLIRHHEALHQSAWSQGLWSRW